MNEKVGDPYEKLAVYFASLPPELRERRLKTLQRILESFPDETQAENYIFILSRFKPEVIDKLLEFEERVYEYEELIRSKIPREVWEKIEKLEREYRKRLEEIRFEIEEVAIRKREEEKMLERIFRKHRL